MTFPPAGTTGDVDVAVIALAVALLGAQALLVVLVPWLRSVHDADVRRSRRRRQLNRPPLGESLHTGRVG